MISSESVEQQKLFAWAEIARMIPEYKGIELMYHIPNEGKRSNYTGGKMKKEGLLDYHKNSFVLKDIE